MSARNFDNLSTDFTQESKQIQQALNHQYQISAVEF
jgi:hypothetical protein